MPIESEGLVLFLLRQGSRREAVRVYQEETGVAHTEAKRAVRNLAHRHGLLARDMGLLGLVLVAMTIVSLLLVQAIH
jgi:hypothetical protein